MSVYEERLEEFLQHISVTVNNKRHSLGLSIIRPHEARECFRILHEFMEKWNDK